MPTTVTVTGAAGQIGYALLFRIASGQLLGPDEKIDLRLLEIPDAVRAAEGTALELQDCAFPLLASTEIYDDPVKAFDGVEVALAIGMRIHPRPYPGHGFRHGSLIITARQLVPKPDELSHRQHVALKMIRR